MASEAIAGGTAVTVIFSLPGLRLESVANAREHWAKKAKRTKEYRAQARLLTIGATHAWTWTEACKWEVRLTRIAPRSLDSDNLASAFKAIRDGIADALGVDDGSPRVSWSYGQRRGKVREYGVDVVIEFA